MLIAILITIAVFIIAAALFLALVPRIRLFVSVDSESSRVYASLKMLGCGIVAQVGPPQVGIALFGFEHFFSKIPFKPKPEAEKTEAEKEKDRKKKAKKALKKARKAEKPRKLKLPVKVWVNIVKAAVLLAGRLAAAVKYEQALLDVRPVVANPALAGMTYGWSRALAAAVPQFGKTFHYTPVTEEKDSLVSGHISFSIKNRRITYSLLRFFFDLPKKEIIANLLFKKR